MIQFDNDKIHPSSNNGLEIQIAFKTEECYRLICACLNFMPALCFEMGSLSRDDEGTATASAKHLSVTVVLEVEYLQTTLCILTICYAGGKKQPPEST